MRIICITYAPRSRQSGIERSFICFRCLCRCNVQTVITWVYGRVDASFGARPHLYNIKRIWCNSWQCAAVMFIYICACQLIAPRRSCGALVKNQVKSESSIVNRVAWQCTHFTSFIRPCTCVLLQLCSLVLGLAGWLAYHIHNGVIL